MTHAPDDAARLEGLLDRRDRGGHLAFGELREMSRLYRVQAARLSQLRRRARADPDAVRYLNALCVRAYSHLHHRERPTRRGRGFWSGTLPRALGRTAHLQLVVTVVLAVGFFVGVRTVALDLDTLPALVPAGMYPPTALERLGSSAEARSDFLRRRDLALEHKSFFGATLFANNTRVGLLSFAVGPLLAVPTLLLVWHNGLILGAFSSVFLGSESRLTFLAWIVPHGIPELLAILLCATGGLAMGLAVVAPGRRTRGQALREAAIDGAHLLIASLPLFVVAAFIESFIRESTLSTAARFAIAGAVGLALVAYVAVMVWLARRRPTVDTSFIA